MIRQVAEWFHGREGELFRRDEAVRRISTALEIDEEEAWRFVRGLTGDLVDPVEQVTVDGEKFVGVISFEKHGFWYRYTHYHDIKGGLERGVCAKCVEEAEDDSEVYHATQGMGSVPEDASVEDLELRLEEHFREVHEKEPGKVETGATLLSGTTIAGNTAIHKGNDGPGSNVNADLLDGTEKASFVEIDKVYPKQNRTLPFGSITSMISAPSSSPYGATVDNGGSIWVAESSSSEIVKHDRSGSTVDSVPSPSSSPKGLGSDSNGCLWNVDSSTFYKIQPQAAGITSSETIPAPSYCRGADFDSSGDLWVVSNGDASIYRLDPANGSILGQIPVPGSFPRGLSINQSTGSIWHTDHEEDTSTGSVYKLDGSGGVLDQFKVDLTNWSPTGIHYESSNDCLWFVQENTDESIFRINQSGSVIEGHPIPVGEPGGLTLDSNNDVFWTVDYSSSVIYKLDGSGSLIDTLDSPESNPRGAALDSSDCLWISHGNQSTCIYQLQISEGSTINSFTVSGTQEGVGVDSAGSIWHVDSADASIYARTSSGSVDSQFSAPSIASARGLTVDDDDSIWYVTDTTDNKAFKTDQSGNVQESFTNPSEIGSPRGTGIDEAGLLWQVDTDSGSVYRLSIGNKVVTIVNP